MRSRRSIGSSGRRAERVGDAELAVDQHPVLHVLRPQGGAAGLQGGGDHQRIDNCKAMPLGEAERGHAAAGGWRALAAALIDSFSEPGSSELHPDARHGVELMSLKHKNVVVTDGSLAWGWSKPWSRAAPG
jgi:hypothetical protein